MKKLRKVIRLVFLSIFLIMALAGIPIVGIFHTQKRDDLFDNEIKIERVETKKDQKNTPHLNDLLE